MGFVSNLYAYSGAADVIVARGSALCGHILQLPHIASSLKTQSFSIEDRRIHNSTGVSHPELLGIMYSLTRKISEKIRH
jgi:hypothetical protein